MTQFGHYTIHRRLGGGGMGDVYLASDRRMNRKVALKILKRKVAIRKEHVQRFLREVQSVARLEHPNIIKVYEVGEESGNHYMAMEYVQGLPLNHALKKNEFDFKNVASIFRDVAGALDHAHGRGVIHRDVKLSNILIGQNGAVKLVDFGLAREFGGSDLTATGQILGTPAYMAPEQIRGEKSRIGPKSDIYSLGAILYVALTGQAPFGGENSVQVLKSVLGSKPVSPRRIRPDVPRTLERICLKAMAREPEDRYATAAGMARDLSRFAEGRFHFVFPNVRMRIRFNLGLAAQVACYAVLVGALTVVLSVAYSQGSQGLEIEALRVENERLLGVRKRLTELDPEADLADARRAAQEGFAQLAGGRNRAALLALSRAEALGSIPSVSRQIEFVRGVLSGEPYRLPAAPTDVLAIGLRGTLLGARTATSLWLSDLATGEVKGTLRTADLALERVEFLEGSRWCAVDSEGLVHWGSLSDPAVRTPLPPAGGPATALAAAPDANRVAVGFAGGLLVLVDAAAEVQATWSIGWPIDQVVFGPDDLLYFVVEGSRLWSVDTRIAASIPHPVGRIASAPIVRLASSPTGSCLIALTSEGHLESCDPRDPFLDSPHSSSRSSLAADLDATAITFHPSGVLVATAEAGGIVRLWLVAEGAEFARIATTQESIRDVDFALGGTVLVAAGTSGLTFHDLGRLGEAR